MKRGSLDVLSAFAAIALLAVLVYAPLLGAPPLSWDDDYNIFRNPLFVVGPWWQVWLRPHYGMYVPVVSSVWAALRALADGEAWPFRVLNILLHIANAACVAVLLDRLFAHWRIDRRRLAVIGAVAIFALHPLQVGAVAWISGSRDLLATFFALAALLIATRAETRKRDLVAALACFALGLLCKPSLAALPAALLAFVALFARAAPATKRTALAASFALAAGAAIVTFLTQSAVLDASPAPAIRALVVLDSFGFYLVKFVWPAQLAADYGRTPASLAAEPSQAALSLAALTVFVAALVLAARRDRRALIAGFALILLAPISGIVDFAFQKISTVADHYAYAPIIALAAASGLALARAERRWGAKPVAAAIAVLAIVLTAADSERVQIWKSDRAFFADMLEKNPHSGSALTNLAAVECANKDELAIGVRHAQLAVQERPQDPPGLADLAYCLYESGRFDEVLGLRARLAEASVRRNFLLHVSAAASFLNSLGSSSVRTGRTRDGLAYLCQAVAVNPLDANAEKNLKVILELARRESPDASCENSPDIESFMQSKSDGTKN